MAFSPSPESNVLSEGKESKDKPMSYSVYIFRSKANELHIGQTNNLPGRTKQQMQKNVKAAKFVKDGKEFHMEYHEEYSSRTEAMRREKQLKGWSRAKKEVLINRDLNLLKQLSKKRKI